MKYKIVAKTTGHNGTILQFEVEAKTLREAEETAYQTLKKEGFPYAKVTKIVRVV